MTTESSETRASQLKLNGGIVRKRIDMNMDVREMIVTMAEGNPGAVTVLIQLVQADPVMGFMDVLHLDDMNMRGPQIWVGFKDHCKQDLAAFQEAIRSRDSALVETVNASRGLAPGTPQATRYAASFGR
jgi:hypothetical protein